MVKLIPRNSLPKPPLGYLPGLLYSLQVSVRGRFERQDGALQLLELQARPIAARAGERWLA